MMNMVAKEFVFWRMEVGHWYYTVVFYLPRRRRPGTGDIATPPVRLSVRPSVCPSVRHV